MVCRCAVHCLLAMWIGIAIWAWAAVGTLTVFTRHERQHAIQCRNCQGCAGHACLHTHDFFWMIKCISICADMIIHHNIPLLLPWHISALCIPECACISLLHAVAAAAAAALLLLLLLLMMMMMINNVKLHLHILKLMLPSHGQPNI